MDKQTIDSEQQAMAEDHPRRSCTLVASSERGDKDVANHDAKARAADEYPHGARLAAIVFSLMLGMFLVALDNVSSPCPRCTTQLTKVINRPSSARPFPK
jgi:hypothetical protein